MTPAHGAETGSSWSFLASLAASFMSRERQEYTLTLVCVHYVRAHICISILAEVCLAENTCELLVSGAELAVPPMDSISTSGAADRHGVDACALQG